MGIKGKIKQYTTLIKRKTLKIWRLFVPKGGHKYQFAIVCVKRTPYVNLTIDNINSLHLINPNHVFTIYCDNVCEEEIKRLWSKFDYPKNIRINNFVKDDNRPWQYSKIEAIIDSSRKGMILIDADGLWHEDPIIDREKIVFQVSPFMIKEKGDEYEVVKEIFKKPEWGDFRYYTSAFVSIPPKYMTDDIASKTREYLDILFNHPYPFLKDQKSRDEQKRQSEQFAINISLLTKYKPDIFDVLKKEDGPKNKNFVQPLYYGCSNQILE